MSKILITSFFVLSSTVVFWLTDAGEGVVALAFAAVVALSFDRVFCDGEDEDEEDEEEDEDDDDDEPFEDELFEFLF